MVIATLLTQLKVTVDFKNAPPSTGIQVKHVGFAQCFDDGRLVALERQPGVVSGRVAAAVLIAEARVALAALGARRQEVKPRDFRQREAVDVQLVERCS